MVDVILVIIDNLIVLDVEYVEWKDVVVSLNFSNVENFVY